MVLVDRKSDMKFIDWNNMQKNLDALYVLDNALTDPAKDYLRLVRKTETDSETRYVVDNGGGDTLDVVFTPKAIVIKGFDHENSLSQFTADEWNQKEIDRMYEGMDSEIIELFSEDERDYSTFVIWYDGVPHQNETQGNDGGSWLLSYACNTYEEFKKFVEGYYSFYSKDFDEEILKKLYENGKLSQEELSELLS